MGDTVRPPSYKTARGMRVVELLMATEEGREVLAQSLAKSGYALKPKEPPLEADMIFTEGQYTLSFPAGSPAAGQT